MIASDRIAARYRLSKSATIFLHALAAHRAGERVSCAGTIELAPEHSVIIHIPFDPSPQSELDDLLESLGVARPNEE